MNFANPYNLPYGEMARPTLSTSVIISNNTTLKKLKELRLTRIYSPCRLALPIKDQSSFHTERFQTQRLQNRSFYSLREP